MKALDALSFPLSGPSLIEASAGTGKTYTIVNLFLRLLLGHKCPVLGIEQILVVTFTQAATAELKARIGDKLRQTYLDFYAGCSDDDFVQSLIEQVDDSHIACQRLDLAAKQLDEAAVFTIHGFCQRMLTQHAFESGAMYEQHFILDESQWLKLASEDYWRKYIVKLEPQILALLLKQWPDPETLLKDVRPLLNRQAALLKSQTFDACSALIGAYSQQVQQVKRWWLEQNIAEQLAQAKLNGRSAISKTSTLAAMQAFCHSNELEPDFHKEGWGLFVPEKIDKARKKGSADLSHLDFSLFEILLVAQQTCLESLRLAIFSQALQAISYNLASTKQRLQLLAPDDLLARLQSALGAGLSQGADKQRSAQSQTLAKSIQQSYPAVLIDEFQDTDPVQFSVFSEIYQQSYLASAPCWIMIGDPKQAIYAFRGADIFTYIQAKQLVPEDQQFTLATNWRSSEKLVEAVNAIFSQSKQGFLFEQNIPFYPVQSVKKNVGLQVAGKELANLAFSHLRSTDGTPISWTEAQLELARHTAGQISRFLIQAQLGQASINTRTLLAGDICVLVRDRNEADLIKQALSQLKVASVFLIRKSIFATQTASDLFLLLKALVNPADERQLKLALMTELFAFTATELDALFADELAWQGLLEQFFGWHKDWQRFGLMLALNKVSLRFNLYRKLASHYEDGQRRLTDLRHVCELLQQQSVSLQGEVQLLHWFQEMLRDPDHNHEGQQLRLETEANLVKIITQHSSKGLEFPLVFIPFAGRSKSSKRPNKALYHDNEQRLTADLLAAEDSLILADRERLAEDIRLLYVALTRAVYYCCVGIWNSQGASKNHSALSSTAIGSVLFDPHTTPDDTHIKMRIENLAEQHAICYESFSHAEKGEVLPLPLSLSAQSWQGALLSKPVYRQWRLTSYSAISSAQQHLEVILPGMDEGHNKVSVQAAQAQDGALNAFSFQRGAKAGSFLHGVLENIDFQHLEQLPAAIEQQGSWFGIDASCYPMLVDWLTEVVESEFYPPGPDNQHVLSLAHLAKHQYKVEMEFHMPLHKVALGPFNSLINQFNPQHGRHYQFEQLNGMLKGYIDLTLAFDGKYYVADYKSNHLGYQLEDYQLAALEQAMAEHDYHLQAILYTLALHRWLKQKLTDYDFEQHIGGAYYLFLRGMSRQQPGSGIYFYRPPQALILALDKLFSGQADSGSASKPDSQVKGQLALW
jgi:exodeoxyribonuclease V beta subunit